MRNPKGVRHHTTSPEAWRNVPNWTGDYDFDASILHCKNKDAQRKLWNHLSGGSVYEIKNAYNSYETNYD